MHSCDAAKWGKSCPIPLRVPSFAARASEHRARSAGRSVASSRHVAASGGRLSWRSTERPQEVEGPSGAPRVNSASPPESRERHLVDGCRSGPIRSSPTSVTHCSLEWRLARSALCRTPAPSAPRLGRRRNKRRQNREPLREQRAARGRGWSKHRGTQPVAELRGLRPSVRHSLCRRRARRSTPGQTQRTTEFAELARVAERTARSAHVEVPVSGVLHELRAIESSQRTPGPCDRGRWLRSEPAAEAHAFRDEARRAQQAPRVLGSEPGGQGSHGAVCRRRRSVAGGSSSLARARCRLGRTFSSPSSTSTRSRQTTEPGPPFAWGELRGRSGLCSMSSCGRSTGPTNASKCSGTSSAGVSPPSFGSSTKSATLRLRCCAWKLRQSGSMPYFACATFVRSNFRPGMTSRSGFSRPTPPTFPRCLHHPQTHLASSSSTRGSRRTSHRPCGDRWCARRGGCAGADTLHSPPQSGRREVARASRTLHPPSALPA